jgi:hypothetical protein
MVRASRPFMRTNGTARTRATHPGRVILGTDIHRTSLDSALRLALVTTHGPGSVGADTLER